MEAECVDSIGLGRRSSQEEDNIIMDDNVYNLAKTTILVCLTWLHFEDAVAKTKGNKLVIYFLNNTKFLDSKKFGGAAIAVAEAQKKADIVGEVVTIAGN